MNKAIGTGNRTSPVLTLVYWLGVSAVAATAFLASFSHIYEVALVGGQSTLVARLLPVSIDGMMVVASVRIAKDRAAGLAPTGWAKFGLVVGVMVSLACNVADIVVKRGVDGLAIGIAAVAPLMLALVVEIITKPGKKLSNENPAMQVAVTEPVADEAASKDLPEAPISPAAPRSRGDYGPRDPERGYAPSTVRAKKAVARATTKPAA